MINRWRSSKEPDKQRASETPAQKVQLGLLKINIRASRSKIDPVGMMCFFTCFERLDNCQENLSSKQNLRKLFQENL